MKYRILRKRIVKTIEGDMSTDMKYLQIRKNFVKMFRQKTPTGDFTNKEKVAKAVSPLNKIYYDDETPILFKQLLPGLDITRTADFLKFLEKILDEKEE